MSVGFVQPAVLNPDQYFPILGEQFHAHALADEPLLDQCIRSLLREIVQVSDGIVQRIGGANEVFCELLLITNRTARLDDNGKLHLVDK